MTGTRYSTIRGGKQSAAASEDAAAGLYCAYYGVGSAQPFAGFFSASMARSVTSVTLPSAEMVTTRSCAR